MTITINGSGTITGATTMASATAFSSTVSAAGNVTLAGSGVKLLNNSGNPVVQQAGSVLQVVQTVKTDGFSLAGGTWTDVTGFSVSITPTSSSSKVLVMFSAYATQTGTTGTYGTQLRLVRNATTIYVGDAAGSAQQSAAQIGSTVYNYAQNLSGTYLDSPATTSSTTYKLQMYVETSSTGFIGGTYQTASAYNARVPSQILVMEIAA